MAIPFDWPDDRENMTRIWQMVMLPPVFSASQAAHPKGNRG